MYTIGFVPANKAAKTLSNPNKFRRVLMSQVPFLAERAYGLMVKDAITKGFLNFATGVSFDPQKGVVHRLPGFTVLKAAEQEAALEHQKAVVSEERKAKAKKEKGKEAAREPLTTVKKTVTTKAKFGGLEITDQGILRLIETATAKVIPMLAQKAGRDLG